MQYVIQERVSYTDGVDYHTTYVDVSPSPLLVVNLIVYGISGPSAQVGLKLETSDDLETWAEVGVMVTSSATGSALGVAACSASPYGRYVRARVQLSGGIRTTFSIVLNTFPSS